MRKEKVILAMSGGVDSSAAALLLREKYDVIGVTFLLWARPGADSAEPARSTARELDIPHCVVDLRKKFYDKVVKSFCGEYARGRTPNPCVRCNQHIKFAALFKKADELDAGLIATGHYARIERYGRMGKFCLKKGVDPDKDQSYFLYCLPAESLEKILMPLGIRTKSEVRRLAAEMSLSAAKRPESQEICFLQGGDYREFLLSRVPEAAKPGDIIDKEGNTIGRHKGIIHYTIGQRKGLGIKGTEPRYVVSLEGGKVVAGKRDDLYSGGCVVSEVNFLFDEIVSPSRFGVKIRHPGPARPATVLPGEKRGELQVVFDEPVQAVSPGQSAVFYKDDIVAGGGIIQREVRKSG